MKNFEKRVETEHMDVETENAKYNVVYGNHGIATSPEFMNNVDAVLLEHVMSPEDTTPKGVEFDLKILPQYREIIRKAFEDKKPLFIVDEISNLDDMMESQKEVEKYLKTIYAEAITGALVATGAVVIGKKALNDPVMSRRKFLGLAGSAAGLAVASHLFTPFASFTAAKKHETLGDDARGALESFVQKTHPELDARNLDGRNYLIAEKSERVAKELKKQEEEKPNLGLVVGAMHTGVEETLQLTQEERVEKIKEYYEDKTKDQAKIIRIDFSDDGISVSYLEDEGLANT